MRSGPIWLRAEHSSYGSSAASRVDAAWQLRTCRPLAAVDHEHVEEPNRSAYYRRAKRPLHAPSIWLVGQARLCIANYTQWAVPCSFVESHGKRVGLQHRHFICGLPRLRKKIREGFKLTVLRRIEAGSLFLTLALSGAASAQSGAVGSCGAKGSDSVRVYIGTTAQMMGPPSSSAGAAKPEPTQGIYAACLDQRTGALSIGGLAAEVPRASWMTANPKTPVLYSTGSGKDPKGDGSLFSLGLDPASPKLRTLAQVDSGGTDPTYLALDEPSKTLFVANHGDGRLTALPITSDGSAGAVAATAQDEGSGPTKRQAGPAVHGIAIDPSGRYILSVDFGADRIFVYHFDPKSRSLTPAATPFVQLPAGSGPRHAIFDRSGKLVFLLNEMTADVVTYRWHSDTGRLEKLQTTNTYPADFSGEKSAAEILSSRDGRFLYVSLRGNQDSVIAYKVDAANGGLTEVQRIPTGGKTPWAMSMDPSGRWLLIANMGSDAVAVLKIDPASGKLSPTKDTAPISHPFALAFAPW